MCFLCVGEVLILLLGLCFLVSSDPDFPQTLLLFSLHFGCNRDGCTSGMALAENILPWPGRLPPLPAAGAARAGSAGAGRGFCQDWPCPPLCSCSCSLAMAVLPELSACHFRPSPRARAGGAVAGVRWSAPGQPCLCLARGNGAVQRSSRTRRQAMTCGHGGRHFPAGGPVHGSALARSTPLCAQVWQALAACSERKESVWRRHFLPQRKGCRIPNC